MQSPAPDPATIDPELARLLAESGLRPLHWRGRTLLPIVQGGMGVGISAHRLAGSVAALGGVGTISSVDLRRHHPDLMQRTQRLGTGAAAKAAIDAANLEALRREIGAARTLAQGRGVLAINVMRAVGEYAASVTAALECGIDAVVVGAGLPLDLPELARDHPDTLLVPILSDARGVQLLVRKWQRRQRLPDAIVIEHPRLAGGHLGAARIEDLGDPRFEFENAIPQTLAFLRSAGIEREVPVIAAGGVRSRADIARLQSLGAAAVQLGTPFAVTDEGDAHPEFKRVLAEADDSDLVEFISVAGLPARAVRTPWLDSYLKAEARLQAVAHVKPRCTLVFDCLAQCGLRDGLPGWGQFCIDTQLAAALRGDVRKGLFFRGVGEAAVRPARRQRRRTDPAPARRAARRRRLKAVAAIGSVARLALGLGAALALVTVSGRRRWQAGTRALQARLEAAREPVTPTCFDPRDLDGLPAPVRRYLSLVLEPGRPMLAAARLAHRGSFNISETRVAWHRFSSTERVVMRRPGFDWDGRIRVGGLTVHVHDAYIAGRGLLEVKLLGLLPLAEVAGTPEVSAGELMRFVAEAPWYPTALLPSQGVQWLPLDAAPRTRPLQRRRQPDRARLPLRQRRPGRCGAGGGALSQHRRPAGRDAVARALPGLPAALRHAGADAGRGGLAAAGRPVAVLARPAAEPGARDGGLIRPRHSARRCGGQRVAEPDRRRHHADDLREQRAVRLVGRMAGQRVAVQRERIIELGPVLSGERTLGQRQHLGLLQAHVGQVEIDVVPRRRFEGRPPRLAHHLEREQRVLELADRALALVVLAVEPIEHRTRLGAAAAQPREQQARFLRVVQPFGKLVDVEQHRAQRTEVGQAAAASVLVEQQHQRLQHRRQRLVFVSDDADRRVLHGLFPGGLSEDRTVPAARC